MHRTIRHLALVGGLMGALLCSAQAQQSADHRSSPPSERATPPKPKPASLPNTPSSGTGVRASPPSAAPTSQPQQRPLPSTAPTGTSMGTAAGTVPAPCHDADITIGGTTDDDRLKLFFRGCIAQFITDDQTCSATARARTELGHYHVYVKSDNPHICSLLHTAGLQRLHIVVSGASDIPNEGQYSPEMKQPPLQLDQSMIVRLSAEAYAVVFDEEP